MVSTNEMMYVVDDRKEYGFRGNVAAFLRMRKCNYVYFE